MIFLFLAAALAGKKKRMQKYLARVVPKALWFEKLDGKVKVMRIVKSDGKIRKVSAKLGKRAIMCDIGINNSEMELLYAEADNRDGWHYQRATAEEDRIGIELMRKMVNSLVPPELVRSTSHRVKEIDGCLHHQMTLIMQVYGKRSMQFLEWKNIGDRHEFVDHKVIAKEGEEI